MCNQYRFGRTIKSNLDKPASKKILQKKQTKKRVKSTTCCPKLCHESCVKSNKTEQAIEEKTYKTIEAHPTSNLKATLTATSQQQYLTLSKKRDSTGT